MFRGLKEQKYSDIPQFRDDYALFFGLILKNIKATQSSWVCSSEIFKEF